MPCHILILIILIKNNSLYYHIAYVCVCTRTCMSIMDFYPMRTDCGLSLKVLGKIERWYLLLKPYKIRIRQETKVGHRKMDNGVQGNAG